jgi:predicted ABC-type sugar transport system permease subunit
MDLLIRVFGLSALGAGFGALLGFLLFAGNYEVGVSLLLGCVGAVVGAIAGAALEITTAMRRRANSGE